MKVIVIKTNKSDVKDSLYVSDKKMNKINCHFYTKIKTYYYFYTIIMSNLIFLLFNSFINVNKHNFRNNVFI